MESDLNSYVLFKLSKSKHECLMEWFGLGQVTREETIEDLSATTQHVSSGYGKDISAVGSLELPVFRLHNRRFHSFPDPGSSWRRLKTLKTSISFSSTWTNMIISHWNNFHVTESALMTYIQYIILLCWGALLEAPQTVQLVCYISRRHDVPDGSTPLCCFLCLKFKCLLALQTNTSEEKLLLLGW